LFIADLSLLDPSGSTKAFFVGSQGHKRIYRAMALLFLAFAWRDMVGLEDLRARASSTGRRLEDVSIIRHAVPTRHWQPKA
jgi:hypothetical protein